MPGIHVSKIKLSVPLKMSTPVQTRHSLPLKSLNHVSRVCRDVHATTHFYEHVLGFVPIKRPGSFDFDGAWLHNYGISIHLIQAQGEELTGFPSVEREIHTRDDHLSFQSDSVVQVEEALREHGIKYIKDTIDEGGIEIDQIFFHDPDGFMIEICTCEKFPVQPLTGCQASEMCLVRTISARKRSLTRLSLDRIKDDALKAM